MLHYLQQKNSKVWKKTVVIDWQRVSLLKDEEIKIDEDSPEITE
jgi:hypothetical protein